MNLFLQEVWEYSVFYKKQEALCATYLTQVLIRCFGAIRQGIKCNSPVKPLFQFWYKYLQNILALKHSVLYIDHPLHHFYEPHYGLG